MKDKVKLAVALCILSFVATAQMTGTTDADASKAVNVTPDTRPRYTAVIEKKIASWDRIISRVKSGKYDSQDFKEDVSQEEAKQLAQDLSQQRRVVAQLLQEMKNSKGEEWKNVQVKIESELNKMGDKFREAE